MHKQILFRFLLAFLFFVSACNQQGETITGKVVGVKDGDTIEVLVDNTPETIRLAEIDCPEKGQPYGQAAKRFTSDICFGKNVKVVPQPRRDQYGRIIATVYIDDTVVLNKELLKAGMAWHYKHFSENEEYSILEYNARENKTGLWKTKKPTPPWKWRKKSREVAHADLVE